VYEFTFASIGWFLGTCAMWAHFHFNHLIRSRSEWYRDRKTRGYDVPSDWESDY
jgi:hypothetical protein